MASTSTQLVYSWYGYSGFYAWVDYTAVRSGTGNIRLYGTVHLKCASLSGQGYYYSWYNNRINYRMKIDNNGWTGYTQIKENTTGSLIENRTFSSNFDFTQSVAASSTKITIYVHFIDAQNSSAGWVNNTVSWSNVTVPLGEQPPSNAGASVSSITCNSATAKVSVGSQGVGSGFKQRFEYSTSSNFSSYTTTDYTSSSSGSWNLTGLTPATKYYYRSYAVNSAGGINSSTGSFTTRGSKPTLTNASATNPEVYRIIFKLGSINWGECGTSPKLRLDWKYIMDGKTYSFYKEWNNATMTSQTYDTGQIIPGETTPTYYSEVPDDETVSYTWTATTSLGSTTLSGTVACQPSYTAYVIGPSTDYKPVEAEVRVSSSKGKQPTQVVRRWSKI